VLAAVGEQFPGRFILHWFSGSKSELRKAIRYGAFFSVNTAMIASKNGQELIAEMPASRVLTETDGPFVRRSDSPAEPKAVAEVIRYLAIVWDVTEEAAKKVVWENFADLISSRHAAHS